MFRTIVFGLTLVMIAVHVAEWLLLARVARSAQATVPARSALSGLLGLMNFLRFEAFYYVVLLVFWLTTESAVPGVIVFLLGVIHVGGWAGLEMRGKAQELEAVALIAARNPEADAGGARLGMVLKGIALFDALEVVVLVYLAYRLGA